MPGTSGLARAHILTGTPCEGRGRDPAQVTPTQQPPSLQPVLHRCVCTAVLGAPPVVARALQAEGAQALLSGTAGPFPGCEPRMTLS